MKLKIIYTIYDPRDRVVATMQLRGFGYMAISLININAFAAELFPRHLDLPHQFLVRLGYVIECEHAPTELEEEVRAERDQGPEWELWHMFSW